MRVDPFVQLNEMITSVLEAIAYPSLLVLAVTFVVVGALELRSRIRRPEPKISASDRATSRHRDSRRRTNRVAPAAR